MVYKYYVLLIFCGLINCKSFNKLERKLKLESYYNRYVPIDSFYIFGKTKIINPILTPGESYYYKTPKVKDILNNVIINPITKIKIVANDVIIDNNIKFVFGLIDFNNNGSFNDIDIDSFFLAPYGSKNTYIDSSNPWIFTLQEQNSFKVNHQLFCFNSKDIENAEVNLSLGKCNLQSHHEVYTNIKDSDIVLMDNNKDTINISKLLQSKNELFLEFWFDGCGGCIKSFNYIKNNSIGNVYGINVIDEPIKFDNFNNKYGFKYRHFYLSKDDLRKLGNNGMYPSSVVIDTSGNIVDQFHIFPFKS